jgi:hypothetical protein
VDTAAVVPSPGRNRLDWSALHAAVLDAWGPFDRKGAVEERPGISRAVPVIELLDDDVDLAPARHLPPAPAAGGTAALAEVQEELADTLRMTAELMPSTPGFSPAESPGAPGVSVGELVRSGALELRSGGAESGRGGGIRVLTEPDVLAGTEPSGSLLDGAGEDIVLVRAGDLVVPVLGGGSIVRVVDEATEGAALGRNLQLLRPDFAVLDSWFLAGCLRGTANNRQASSFASTATRLDVRRLHVPRIPLVDQRRYGEHFRALAMFEGALRKAGRLGEQLVQGLYDGLADGTVSM